MSTWNLQTYLQERYKTELAQAFKCELCGHYGTRMMMVYTKLYHLACAAKVMRQMVDPLPNENNVCEMPTCALRPPS